MSLVRLLMCILIGFGFPLGSIKAASSEVLVRFDPEYNNLSISMPADAMHDRRADIPAFLSIISETDQRITLGGKLPDISRPDARFGSSEGGVFLFSALDWLSSSELDDGLLILESPANYPGLATGRAIEERQINNQFIAEYDLTGSQDLGQLHIFFGPYQINTQVLDLGERSLELRTYFKAENQGDAEDYLRAAAGYIERYNRQIGDYPFERFSVVSAPIPVGLGLDRMTYVSEQILGHSYMLGRSLAHEVLHSWWGSGVNVDYQQGNWAEGLTTFMADYALAEERSETAAKEMRRGWLEALNQVEKYEPLSRFRYAPRRSDQSVGYGKSAMLFYALRQHLGEKAFYSGLRQFWDRSKGSVAGWDQLQAALESASGMELSEQFGFWLSARALPEYSVEITSQTQTSEGYGVRLLISAENAPPTGHLPVQLVMGQSAETHWIEYSGSPSEVEIVVASKADRLELDPNFEVLRRLDKAE